MSVFTLVAGCVCLLVAAVGGGLVLFGSPRVRVIGAVFAGIHAVIAAVLFVAFALWRRMLKKNALPQPGDVPRDLQNYGYIRLRLQGVSLLIAGVILLAGGLIAAFVLSGGGIACVPSFTAERACSRDVFVSLRGFASSG